MHPFDDAISLTPVNDNRFRGSTSAAYGNMVGPFGGVTNAVLLNAALLHPERQGEPVALTVNFAGPVADGEFEIEATPVRTNRSTQHWSLKQLRGENVQTTATAVFATRREGWSAAEAVAPEGIAAPESLPRLTSDQTPAWFQRYDMRISEGGLDALDGRGHLDSLTRLWIRDDPPRPLSFTSLAAVCDNFFPRIFLRLGRVVPAGTVSMTTYFHAEEAHLREQADGFVLGVARGLNFRDGFFDQSAEIWSDTGQLLASSHQVVYYRS